MGRTLRMPSEADLPPGAVRDFVEEVFGLYRAAHRPSLRHVSEMIRRSDQLAGTASPETIRRMLLGLTVPTHWSTVEAVLVVFCDLAGLDPDQELGGYYRDDDSPSRRESLEGAWHRALDHPDERDEPKRKVTTGADADPWATDGPRGYSDEPPF